MRTSTLRRFVISFLLFLSGCFFGHGVSAQTRRTPAKTGTSLLTGTGTITLSGPVMVCVNTAAVYTSVGSGCSGWGWDAGGGAISQTETSGKSTATITWSTPGTYTVYANAFCTTDASATKTVTVTAPVSQPITISGSAEQITASGATICAGATVQLLPPAGSTNWVWSGAGAYITPSSSGAITIQPTAALNYYNLSYTPYGSACTNSSTFMVKVTSLPTIPVVQTNAGLNEISRLGPGVINLTVKDANPEYTYRWYDTQYSTSVLYQGTMFSPNVTDNRTYYVSATSCKESARLAVSVTVRQVQITIGGNVPTGPQRLLSGVPILLQAQTSGTYSTYSWLFNGQEITGQTGPTLSVTRGGIYTVRLPYTTGSYYYSPTVELLEGLAGQKVNELALNYFVDTKVLKPGVTTTDLIPQLATADRQQTMTYANGWGQPLQQVAVQAGPSQQDIVQYFGYNGAVTATAGFLPFPISNQEKAAGLYEPDALAKLNTYYSTKGGIPYSVNTTEASPLDRPVKLEQTGSAWAGHFNTVTYQGNSSQEVRLWSVSGDSYSGNQWYAEGQLSKQITLDADNRRIELFHDQAGRLILQRKVTVSGTTLKNYDTYNVYADAGYLQLVIPPAAVDYMNNALQWNIPTICIYVPTFKDQWLYQYTYDSRGRLAERRFPGAAPVYLVYDKFNRAILVQDGNHRVANQWLFTKFDAQNRAVVAGLYTQTVANSSITRQADLQAQADGTAIAGEFESRTSSGYTTNNTFPSVTDGSNGWVLSQTFYDDYDLDGNGQPDYAYSAQVVGTDPQPIATTQLRGLTTVTRTRVVLPGGQYGSWLTSVHFYDEFGNQIQKQSNNLLQSGTGLGDITTMIYRQQGFVAQVVRSIKTQQTSTLTGNFSPTVTVRTRYSYDAAGRPLQAWQQHLFKSVWEPEVLVSSNTYTGLGEMTQKKLHSRDGVKFLQTEDFAYNLHGQLQSINNSDQLLNSNPDDDLFALDITREQSVAIGNTPRYDGGISAISWASHNAAQTNQPERQRSYRFTYDGLGRLTDALYAARPGPYYGWGYEQGAYDEKVTSYDANGNIKGLQRYSLASDAATRTLLDNLTFDYAGNGNRQNKVDDAGDATRGFKNQQTAAVEYDYDPNGSIIRDGNKGVTYTYNALNKVEKQTVGTNSISYTYDANGAVLKRVTVNAAGNQTEYYVDGFVYESSTGFAGLRSLPTPEGRAIVTAAADTKLTYEYHLRDHLGNLRVAFRAQANTETLQLSSEPTEKEGPYPNFENIAATRSQHQLAMPAKDASWVAAVTKTRAGPAISVPVSHGDHLEIQVYCKTPYGIQYNLRPPTSSSLVARSLPAVALALTPTVLPRSTKGGMEGQSQPQFTPGIQLSISGLLATLTTKPRQLKPTSAGPALTGTTQLNASIAWSLLNSKGTVIRSGTKAVPVITADAEWHAVNLPLDIDLSTEEARTGTLRIQEVNDAPQPVFFDLLTITHPQDIALVSQEQHYYPFGMAMSGIAVNTLPAAKVSKQQFNGGSELQDELVGAEAGVYSTFYRTYDPTIGRFTGVDPLADQYTDQSDYQFANNDPVNFNDPSGALSEFGSWAELIRAWLADSNSVPEGHYESSGGSDGGGITMTSEIYNVGGQVGYYALGGSSQGSSDPGHVNAVTNVPGTVTSTATFVALSSTAVQQQQPGLSNELTNGIGLETSILGGSLSSAGAVERGAVATKAMAVSKLAGNTLASLGFAVTAYNLIKKHEAGKDTAADYVDAAIGGSLLIAGFVASAPVAIAVLTGIGLTYAIIRVAGGEQIDAKVNSLYSQAKEYSNSF